MRLRRRHAAIPIALAGALLVATTAGARSERALDIRGNWSMPTVTASGARYPQVWAITSENRATGAWRGYIKGNAGSVTWGTISGHTFISHAKLGTYTSRGKASLVTTGANWRLVNGTFLDSQHTTGTFTGVRLSKTPG